jgi:hypothetical protein
MNMARRKCDWLAWIGVTLVVILAPRPARAWLGGPGGEKVQGIAEAWKLNPVMGKSNFAESDKLRVDLIESSIPGNILFPGEQPRLTFQIVNKTNQPLRAKGTLDLVRYGLATIGEEVFKQRMYKMGDAGSTPIEVDVPPGGCQQLILQPQIPATLGAYAAIVDLRDLGRYFGAGCVRTFAPDSKRVQYPQMALDRLPPAILQRLGIKAIRYGLGYKPTTDPDFEQWYQKMKQDLLQLQAAHVTVLLTVWWPAHSGPLQPLGQPRPKLDDHDTMLKDAKPDVAWLPSYDADFQQWCRRLASDQGWPKGPITAFALWNEPWEGSSIDYWGADMLRFREMFTHMAMGVEQARKDAGVDVLLGGCDSSSNTFDKLFSDGSDTFLKWLDVCTVHYQGMTVPTLYKKWINRPGGHVRVWDTESWVANSEDRVATVLAGTLSTGQERTVGVYHGNILHTANVQVYNADGTKSARQVYHSWSVAAAVAAGTHFIGERKFSHLLFQNGLPFVMVFDGGQAAPDDGVVVVVGDLGGAFGRDSQVFRTVDGLENKTLRKPLEEKLAASPANSPEHKTVEAEIQRLNTRVGGTLRLSDGAGKFQLYDFFGNAMPSQDGRITVPLDGRGFFLRSDGSKGCFAMLLDALRQSRIEGIEPAEIKAYDMLARVETKPSLRLTLTNVLNRPVSGGLHVTIKGLSLADPSPRFALAPNETRDVVLQIVGGKSSENNAYPLHVDLDAGADGHVEHEETMHVNVIPRRTVTIDGSLEDWRGVPGQTISDTGANVPTLTEAAWFPFMKFDASLKGGVATGYLAYDDQYFYFAAKVADDTPDEGMRRYAALNDDEFFYPQTSYEIKNGKRIAHQWPVNVRRYSYRKSPELPDGSAPPHDNVQIAFNVLDASQKDMIAFPPGTMPGYIPSCSTDYEFALNKVADKYGGGYEIWKLLVPGMPEKHFYPRQPKSPLDGAVTDGKLAVTHVGNTRIVEAAIPWSAIPAVKQRLDAAQPICFSFRVNDNKRNGTLELAKGRSVSSRSPYAFHVSWKEHWANEIQFAFEK